MIALAWPGAVGKAPHVVRYGSSPWVHPVITIIICSKSLKIAT